MNADLPLIHVIAAKTAASINMVQLAHEGIDFSGVARLGDKLEQPLAECHVKRLAPRTRDHPGLRNQVAIRAESDFFHAFTTLIRTSVPTLL